MNINYLRFFICRKTKAEQDKCKERGSISIVLLTAVVVIMLLGIGAVYMAKSLLQNVIDYEDSAKLRLYAVSAVIRQAASIRREETFLLPVNEKVKCDQNQQDVKVSLIMHGRGDYILLDATAIREKNSKKQVQQARGILKKEQNRYVWLGMGKIAKNKNS